MALYQTLPGGSILRTADNATIPPDLGNQDYQAFLAWVGGGNTPDAPAAPPASASLAPADLTFAADPWQSLATI